MIGRLYVQGKAGVTSRPRTQDMSTRILGVGIFMVGVLVLFVGLIIGLEFPKHVYNKLVTAHSMCACKWLVTKVKVALGDQFIQISE